METVGLKILLIEPDKNQSEFLTGILMELGYQVIRAGSTETAVQKIFPYSPDAIICQKRLNGDSGFLFFSMLRNKLSDTETPFILLLDSFDEKDLSLGFEMGVESFLYPPFEPEKISHILQHQTAKKRGGKADTANQFKSFFEATPFGFFVCKNSTLIDSNSLFFKMVNKSGKMKGKLDLTDVFNFGSDTSDELKLLRCLNGISTYCSFRSISLHSDLNVRFNIFLNVVENGGASLKIAGLVIPDDKKYEPGIKFNELHRNLDFSGEKLNTSTNTINSKSDVFFTKREKQVLKLSAEGAPIKQIAHQMGISVRTVEKHRSNIFRKTNSGNIVEAVFYVNKKQLLDLN